MRDRVTFPQDFWEHGEFFFSAPVTYDQGLVSKKWNADAVKVFTAYLDAIAVLGELDAASAKSTLESVASAAGISTGKILQALRLVITGVGGGPDLMMIMEIIGKTEVMQRIDRALKTFKVKVS